MEAKDTVMSYKKCQVAKLPVTPPHTDDERIAQAQAEISFKAGIGEVTEWIKPRLDKISELVGNIRGDWTDPRGDCRAIWDILAEIEAKLKEWGIG